MVSPWSSQLGARYQAGKHDPGVVAESLHPDQARNREKANFSDTSSKVTPSLSPLVMTHSKECHSHLNHHSSELLESSEVYGPYQGL